MRINLLFIGHKAKEYKQYWLQKYYYQLILIWNKEIKKIKVKAMLHVKYSSNGALHIDFPARG